MKTMTSAFLDVLHDRDAEMRAYLHRQVVDKSKHAVVACTWRAKHRQKGESVFCATIAMKPGSTVTIGPFVLEFTDKRRVFLNGVAQKDFNCDRLNGDGLSAVSSESTDLLQLMLEVCCGQCFLLDKSGRGSLHV